MDEQYQVLINAIVMQAFKDLQWANRRLKKYPHDYEAKYMVKDVERFCKSGYAEFLTGFSGDWMLELFWEHIDELHNHTHE